MATGRPRPQSRRSSRLGIKIAPPRRADLRRRRQGGVAVGGEVDLDAPRRDVEIQYWTSPLGSNTAGTPRHLRRRTYWRFPPAGPRPVSPAPAPRSGRGG